MKLSSSVLGAGDVERVACGADVYLLTLMVSALVTGLVQGQRRSIETAADFIYVAPPHIFLRGAM